MHGCTLSARTHVCAVGNRAYRWGFSRVPGCTLSARTHVCAVGNRAYRWGDSRTCTVGNRAYRWGVLARAWLHIVSAHPRLRGWKPRLPVVGSRACAVAHCKCAPYVVAVGNRAYRWWVLAHARLRTAPIGGGFWHLRLSCGTTNWRVQPPRQPCPYRVYTQNYRSTLRSWRRCCSPKRRRCARSSRHR